MDELLSRAIQRRNELRKELEALDRFIADYSPVVFPARSDAPPSHGDDLFTPRQSTRSERAAAVTAMMDEAERLILRAGEPLTRSALVERLEAAGHRIVGGDKNKVLGTNLWRSRRFHNIQGIGYWPRAAVIPEKFARFPIRDTMLSA